MSLFKRFSIRTAISALAVGMLLLPVACIAGKGIDYPSARMGDVVDDYHGTKVADPYRWLEDEHSSETHAWIKDENKITFDYLNAIPQRAKIKDRLTDLWNYEKYGIPYKKGGRYFFEKNDGLQNQYVLYTAKSLDDEPRVLIDPNTLSKDGTIALSGKSVSEDGRLMAYGLSEAGSDWQTWRVRDIETGKDLDDKIEWVKFSGASWTKDGKGFFYSRYDAPKEGAELQGANYFQKLYYHHIGMPQSADELIYQRPDQKEWGFGGLTTDDGRYLIISVWKGTARKNMIFYKDLQNPSAKVTELIGKFEAQFSFIDNDGSTFFFKTDLDAALSRVIAIDLDNPDRGAWKEVVAQTGSALKSVNLIADMFVATYLTDARSEVKMYSRDGKLVREPSIGAGLGTVSGFGGKKTDTETFYSFTSYTDPGTIYRYDLASGASEVLWSPKVEFNADEYETRQVFYRGKDGTKIPMFITGKKGYGLTGQNPTLLYGYGGFDISITPRFKVSQLVWMEMGGLYVVANIRGGGEYGKEWHEAGMKSTKQNCFDDFIAAAEYLIANKYTSTPKLAISGASNGGLLVGACMTQRPDLFGACLPAVGVMDMLRFHKFTIGWAWTSDYGSPDIPEEFKTLYAYSPLHNVQAGTAYPSTMITTADHDDRVVPAHSFKFAAALQAAHTGSDPVLIRIQTQAGHGAGKPTSMRIEEAADIWAFLVKELDMKVQ